MMLRQFIAFFFIGTTMDDVWGHIDAGHAALDALRVFAVSTLVGLGLGFGFYLLMKLFSNKRGELFAFIVEAYVAYVLAEEMHVSGILTLIVAIVATKAWIDSDLANDNSKKIRPEALCVHYV